MQKIYAILTLLVVMFCFQINTQAQCAAQFTIWQDTSASAQPSTYFGNNTCIGSNFIGIDTINYTYTWNWGDGSSTTAPFPTHVYATPGIYTICLYMNAIASSGCNDTTCLSQTINKHRVMYSVNIINPYIVTSLTSNTVAKPTIYPNPVTSIISIYGLSKGQFDYQIFTLDGKLIQQAKVLDANHIDVANLAQGIYTLKVIEASGKVNTLRLVK